MSDNESERLLIERAGFEEKAYNWVEAAKLHAQVVEIYSSKKAVEKLSEGLKKVGFSYLRAVETADTEEELFKRSEHAIKAYEEASNLFKQRGSFAEELECRAEICYIKGFIASNAMEWKSEFNKSLELFTKSSKIYFEEEDLSSYLRALSRAGMASFSLSQYLDNKSALMEMYHKGIDITEKAWEVSIATENFQYIGEIIYSMINLNVIPIYITNFKKDKRYKGYMWELNEKVEKSLTYLEENKDARSLALLYFAYAHVWSGYTIHYIEDAMEHGIAFDKGIDLFEKAIVFSREANIKFILIFSLFWLNWWMIYGQKYNYVQKRILNDIDEVIKLGSIYKHSNIGLYFFANFLRSLYYANISNFRMFKLTQRKIYAEKGFEFAQECLKTDCLHPMIASTLYQVLTYSCSLLVNLSPTDIERNEQTLKMIKYAEQANKIGERLEGGLARAAGYSSLYRAYKTQADITEDDSFRIRMLQSASNALENYLSHTMESVTARFIIELRLGLLLEGIGIATGKSTFLLKSKELILNMINEGIKKGYYQYVASGFESVARIEDRLGNYLSSAEHYRKADDSYTTSLKNVKYSLLKKRIRAKQSYVQAWNLIETAKLFHKREEHLKAKGSYEKACQILEKIPKYTYEAIYYSAWTFLEEAEQLGKQEYHEEAIEYYTKTKENFNVAINRLKKAFEGTKEDRERERIEKLKKVAKVRIRYCSARINIEEARILGKKGDHLTSAEKFSSAASQFKEVCNSYKIEREKKELEAVYYLCRAWENMESAEQYQDPNRFAEASDLFVKASKLFMDSKMKLLSSGNSAFCQALEYGYKFDKSIDMTTKADLYPKVKILLRKATNSYRKGNFESGAGWALATSTYFDAAWHLIKADVEMSLREKKKLLEVAAKLLRSASDLFEEAGYQYKQKEIKNTLKMLQKEEKILISAINTIKKPSISESTVGIIAPACPHESSQSLRISEVREFGEEIAKAEIKEPSREKYQLIYKDLLKEHPENQQQEFRVGIAQIGLSSTDNILDEFYMDDGSGLLHLREDKVDTISEKVKDVINNAQKNEINILIFPEMSIDLTYGRLIEEISNLAKKFNMYIIPGSYHELSTRRNLCLVISPDGVLWEQEKNIPAMINFKGTRFKEGIESGRFPRKITICNTEYGRIAIAICRDFLDMDLRVEIKNFEPPVDLIINPAFTPVTADFKAAHFDARRSIYAYCFFANIGEYGNSLIYTPEKERIERTLPPKEEGLIFKDIDLFKLRSERKKWQKIHEEEKKFIQSTR